MAVYFNEFDPKKAAWLRELMKAGLIADGEVDERSIRDVQPADLDGFTQCHFFAGIGVWSHCLRRAGWPDDREVWTGSPPCQPFSVAGKKQAQADDRHLWPDLFRLLSERRPQSFFCEQVASKDGLAWLDIVLLNLEGAGYAVWPVAVPACGFGAPHKRERLAIVAHADGGHASAKREQCGGEQRLQPSSGEFNLGTTAAGVVLDDTCCPRREGDGLQPILGTGVCGEPHARPAGSGAVGVMDNPIPLGPSPGGHGRNGEHDGIVTPPTEQDGQLGNTSIGGWGERGNAAFPRRGGHADSAEQFGQDGVTLVDPICEGLQGHAGHGHNSAGWRVEAGPIAPTGVANGFWSGAELIWCRDEKWRPVEPGIFPLADGSAKGMGRMRDPGLPINANDTQEARTLRLKGYGDAIVTEVFVAVIEAGMELG